MRLVTWNVAGRVARQPEQAAVLMAVEPDVVALQEVTARTLPLWEAELEKAGFTSVKTALEGVTRPAGARKLLRVLTAARGSLRVLARAAPVLRSRGRRGREPALADLARAGAGQGADSRGGGEVSVGIAGGAPSLVRRPQHPAPRAPRRKRPDIRSRQRRPPAARARRALAPGRERTRARPAGAGLGRRLPRAPRLRRARGELALRERPRRLALAEPS